MKMVNKDTIGRYSQMQPTNTYVSHVTKKASALLPTIESFKGVEPEYFIQGAPWY